MEPITVGSLKVRPPSEWRADPKVIAEELEVLLLTRGSYGEPRLTVILSTLWDEEEEENIDEDGSSPDTSLLVLWNPTIGGRPLKAVTGNVPSKPKRESDFGIENVAYTFDSAEHQYMLVVSYDRQRWNEAGPTGKSLGECVQELLNGVSE
jgi:hypothetical protein